MSDRYSVVIPAYNAQDTLAEALHSILVQSSPPTEIIVIDDGSSDSTASVARSFGPPVFLHSQVNQGCGAATNMGLARVTTPLVAFLDADDVWLPEKARMQLDKFALTSDLAGVCGQAQTFSGSLSAPRLGAIADLWSRTTMMVRTTAASIIGDMIDPPGGRGDTVDWIARGRDLGLRFEMLSEVVSLRRIRTGSLAFGRDASKDRGYLVAVKRALDRKRQAQCEESGSPSNE